MSDTTADVADRVLACFREVFPEASDEQLRAAVREEFEPWDSLASLQLVAIVEEEFDRRLADDVVGDLSTLDAVVAAVEAAA